MYLFVRKFPLHYKILDNQMSNNGTEYSAYFASENLAKLQVFTTFYDN